MMKVVITGANGQLGLAYQKTLYHRGISFLGLDSKACNITSKDQVEQLLDAHKPSILINCAAYNFVDEAENNPVVAFQVNLEGVKVLAQACRDRNVKLVHYSTDYVFDGKKGSPYFEEDAAKPLNVYGQSKVEGEEALRLMMTDYLLFRTSWVYGQGHQNFLYKLSQWAQKTKEIRVSADEISVPTFVDDIVSVTLKAIEKRLTGLYHLTSSGHASRYEWAKVFIEKSDLSTQVLAVPMSYFQLKVQRPLFSAMSNQKISKALGIQIPSWQEGVERYLRLKEGK